MSVAIPWFLLLWRGPVGFGQPMSSKETNVARVSVRSLSDRCRSDGYRPNRAINAMESPRRRTAYLKYFVPQLPFSAPRMFLQISSVG